MSTYVWIFVALWVAFILFASSIRDPPGKYDYPPIPVEKLDVYTTPIDIKKERARQEEAKKPKKPEYTFSPESSNHFATF
jgi:hypothetical protein